jgi:hypothetical protein
MLTSEIVPGAFAMKNKKNGGYADKHEDTTLDAELAQALEKMGDAEGVSCEAAHEVADRLHRSAREAGRAMDLMNLRICRCQLGLFGYTPRKRIVRPATTVDPTLSGEIQAALENGRLACRRAWDLAARCGTTRLAVAETCEALKIKIAHCQLGAF